MIKPGIYNNLDIDEYHASPGISSTGISLILDCPKRYYYEYHQKPKTIDQKEARKQREKYMMGRALHMLVLEPEKFEQTFYCMTEEVNLVTKAGKEVYAQAEIEANGRLILRAGGWEEVKAMAQSVLAHPIWNKMKKGLVEQSIFWNGGLYSTPLRARPDIFTKEIIVDLKTTESITGFNNSMSRYGYHRQAAMQIDSLKETDGHERLFAFFVVEKKAPFLTSVFTLDDVSLAHGRQQYLDGAAIYSECLKNNIWPGYIEDVQLLTLPTWATKEELEDE